MSGIINGLLSGRAGIASHGTAISLVGDNIANSSTIGYKAARAEFADFVVGGQVQGKLVGAGSQVQAVTMVGTPGSTELTNRGLDLAVEGGGFFAVEKDGERLYTRAGNFGVNREGTLVTQDGFPVLGFSANGSGALQPINLDLVAEDVIETENISVSGNLNASATAIDAQDDPTATPPVVGDIPTVLAVGVNPTTEPSRPSYADLSSLAAFSTVVKVFDSLAAPHNITLFFFKDSSAPNQWVVRGYVNSEEVDTAPPTGQSDIVVGEPRLILGSVLDFTNDPPTAMTGTNTNRSIVLEFNANGTRTVDLPFGLYDMTASIPWNNGSDLNSPINISLAPFTQYSVPSSTRGISQDGRGVGSVTGVDVGSSGEVSARYSNGQSQVIGVVALVGFANGEGLSRVGSNLMRESTRSGEPVVGRPGTGKLGTLKAGALELSTVDIANEFVKLISLQRGFQASSRIITTVNQLLNDIIQLA